MGPAAQEDATPPPQYGPCFYLSYAHANDPADPSGGARAGYWVREFFKDLCAELCRIDPRWYGGEGPGFIDWDVPSGARWDRLVAQKLAGCRVFIPLYSPEYFNREICGREWAVFHDRQAEHLRRTAWFADAIVPVLWQPVPDAARPVQSREVSLASYGSGSHYLQRGIYELIRLDRDGEYARVIRHLAADVDRRARDSAPVPTRAVDFPRVRPLFGTRAGADPHRLPLYISIAAPDMRTLPPGRDSDYYGDHMADWNPYHPQSMQSMCEWAAHSVRELGYEPVAGALVRESPELRPARRNASSGHTGLDPDGPGLVLVDPWVTHTPVSRRNVSELDLRRKPWVRVLVPWNADDRQTMDNELMLAGRLQQAMPWSLKAWRSSCPHGLEHLRSLSEFEQALPFVVERARKHYINASFRSDQPLGGFKPRPRLSRGDTGPADRRPTEEV